MTVTIIPNSSDDESSLCDDDCPPKESPKSVVTAAKGKVRVVARIRPLAKYELENGSKQIVHTLPTTTTTTTTSNKQLDGPTTDPEVLEVREINAEKRWFELDAILDEHSTQQSVYVQSGAQQAVQRDIFKGFNCTILAYGQTGSGKTFTMGTAIGAEKSESDGVIPRACADLFDTIHSKRCDGNAKVHLSYLEIYNEEIRDLMADPAAETEKPKPLKIRETLDGDVYVSGLTSREVASPQEIGRLMEEASVRRVVASTKMNAVSSRSHAICVLKIEGVLEDSTKFQSKLTLVDLAGSERIKKTGAQGDRRQEGISINKGLFVLGQVVSALAEKRPKHKRKPPYRDSKLTRLLQDALGGNSQTIMIACCSPADYNVDETVNTLRYATSARNIQNTATRNVVKSITPEEALKLERENQLLKSQVKDLQATIQTMTIDAFDMPSLASVSCETEEDSMMMGDEKDQQIRDLEKQVESLKVKLSSAKVDVRKVAMASAIELPALKIQVEALEGELEETEGVKIENEVLCQELSEVKAEAESARLAASQLSKILEEIKNEKTEHMTVVNEKADEMKEVAREGNSWVLLIVMMLIFQIFLSAWGMGQVANGEARRYKFEEEVKPFIESLNERACILPEPEDRKERSYFW